MSKFEKQFFKVLKESDEVKDRAAMVATLDKETDPEAFDSEPLEVDASDAAADASAAMS